VQEFRHLFVNDKAGYYYTGQIVTYSTGCCLINSSMSDAGPLVKYEIAV